MPDRIIIHAKARPVLWAIIAVCAALLVVWLIWVSIALLEQSRTNGRTAVAAKQASTLILDCTDPSGECFRRGEDRYAEAVSGINAGTLRIIAAALSCQEDGITEEKPLARCTARRASS